MKRLKTLLFLLAAVPALALAAGSSVPLDKAPVNLSDKESLQRGARMFVNYCLNCHSASAMRYTRLEDLGGDRRFQEVEGLVEPAIAASEEVRFQFERIGYFSKDLELPGVFNRTVTLRDSWKP